MNFLQTVWAWLVSFATAYVWDPICAIRFWDVVDILVLAIVLYQIYRFGRNRRAGRVLLGLSVIIVLGLVATLANLTALSYITTLFAASAFFCIVVIFQPEIRDALERLGNSTALNPGSHTISHKRLHSAEVVVDETVTAVFKMSETRTGALIVFEGLTKLGDYLGSGTLIDAVVSSRLIQNIFYDKSPLHDGALIIRDMRIHAASCVLPTAGNNSKLGTVGTRHRAAVGVTEVSDALVVVVSEQTGTVSIAQNGKLLRELDEETLKDVLMTYIAGSAYLRHKRANMRAEYLKMLDNVAKVKTPKKEKRLTEEEMNRHIEEFLADTPSDVEAEENEATTQDAQIARDTVMDSEDSADQNL
ncbi:MAG: diadenylate cyclase CdaA [Clostridia bacterium]|nr:diadenylate cyclase CdaA [Clostridia bacterium]